MILEDPKHHCQAAPGRGEERRAGGRLRLFPRRAECGRCHQEAMDEVDRRIGESVGKVKSWTEMTAEELARLNPEFRAPVVKKSALASQMTADPYGAENRPQPAKIGDMFTVAVDRVELLRQKLDIVNAQLGEQEAKLKALTAQYNETANSKGADSGAAREIDSQITAVQARMVSLQQSVNQTEAAIRKASSGSSGQIQADANRSSGAVGKAMTSVRKKVSDAFQGRREIRRQTPEGHRQTGQRAVQKR